MQTEGATTPVDREPRPAQVGREPHDETVTRPTDADSPTSEFPFLAPAQHASEIGRLGSYGVLGVLGSGGMGVVFRAADAQLKRHIALKVMLPQHASNALAVARFLREARAQAAVEHDHVAAIYQVGEERGIPFIAMPLLKGHTLSDALKSTPRLPVAEAVRIAREMAEGLAAAHDCRLVHRDIKPGNVWLEGKNRRVKILDFGLARVGAGGEDDGPMTQTGAVFGTPAYMSPEQARGEPVDARSDLFSLGSVLYQMLAGNPPFQAGSLTGLLLAVVSNTPPRVSERNPQVAPELDDLVNRLLAKSPEHRPATAADVAERLRGMESGAGAAPAALPEEVPTVVAADRETDTEPTVTRSRSGEMKRATRRERVASNPWKWVAVAAVVATLVVATVIVVKVTGPRGQGTVQAPDSKPEAPSPASGPNMKDATPAEEDPKVPVPKPPLAGWLVYRSEDGYSVNFPVAPTVGAKSAEGIAFRTAMAAEKKTGLHFSVTSSGNTGKIYPQPFVALRTARDDGLERVKAVVVNERELTYGRHPGLDSFARISAGQLKGFWVQTRLYLVHNRLYFCMVLGQDNIHKPDDPEVTCFLDSFQLTSIKD